MSTYIDLNTKFKSNALNDKSSIVDIANIKDSLERLFTTSKGEVPFNRNYGTSLKSLLFETGLDPSDVVMFLYMDIREFEPRVVLNPADISIEQTDRNTFTVSCTFTVVGVEGNPQTVTASVIKG